MELACVVRMLVREICHNVDLLRTDLSAINHVQSRMILHSCRVAWVRKKRRKILFHPILQHRSDGAGFAQPRKEPLE